MLPGIVAHGQRQGFSAPNVPVSYWGNPHRLVSYLVFLLEPVALASLHLGDVLKQVCHSDGRLELVPGVAHLYRVTGPVGVSLNGEGGLGQLPTTAICFKEKEAGKSHLGGFVLCTPPPPPAPEEGRGTELHSTGQEIIERQRTVLPWLGSVHRFKW